MFLTIGQAKLLYRRHFKSYKPDILNYLEEKKLTLLDILYVRKEDWKESPFAKPSETKFSFLAITINGTVVKWNDKKYRIIETKENKSIWLEIDTTYFKKTKLTFKNQKKSRNKLKNIIINQVTDKCPACGYRISKSDNKCPDCGLNFN
ncbi:hypothetical protein GCM10022271_26590 [Corallibacter vietnamensis]|uniref:Zinc ribbon domain-containing protein n=2 Tax=Corallibacter vietnamensis TaxID=904130 RepID=A0ABP7HFG2_9FLAO